MYGKYPKVKENDSENPFWTYPSPWRSDFYIRDFYIRVPPYKVKMKYHQDTSYKNIRKIMGKTIEKGYNFFGSF